MRHSTLRDHLYVSAECLVGFASVVNNIVVLVVIARYRVFHRITNYFIGNLAVADLLVGMVVTPIVIVSYAGLPRHFHGCVLISSVVVLLTSASILSLLALVIERYLAVAKPFLHLKFAKRHIAAGVIYICWLLATLLGLIPNLGWNNGHTYFIQMAQGRCYFTAVITNAYLVYVIFFSLVTPTLIVFVTAYAKLTRDVHSRISTSVQDDSASCGFLSTARRLEEVHTVRSLSREVLVFVICVLPVHVHYTVRQFTAYTFSFYETPFFLASIALSHVPSFTNPIIFAFSSKHFRHAMKCMLQRTRYPSVSPGSDTSRTTGPESSTRSSVVI